jgi:hypothetical protein
LNRSRNVAVVLILFTHWMSELTPKQAAPVDLEQRRQFLTGEIRMHAAGARSKTRQLPSHKLTKVTKYQQLGLADEFRSAHLPVEPC